MIYTIYIFNSYFLGGPGDCLLPPPHTQDMPQIDFLTEWIKTLSL